MVFATDGALASLSTLANLRATRIYRYTRAAATPATTTAASSAPVKIEVLII